jgi:hypothetical protein
MGYYTKLKLNVILNDKGPLYILNEICNKELVNNLYIDKFGELPIIMSVVDTPNLPIEHIFGKSHRWDQIFHNATFNKKTNNLIINCDIKAYDNIYEDLIDWLSPFIVSGSIEEKGEDQDEWLILKKK